VANLILHYQWLFFNKILHFFLTGTLKKPDLHQDFACISYYLSAKIIYAKMRIYIERLS